MTGNRLPNTNPSFVLFGQGTKRLVVMFSPLPTRDTGSEPVTLYSSSDDPYTDPFENEDYFPFFGNNGVKRRQGRTD